MTTDHGRQWESHPAHAAGRRLLAGSEVSGCSAVFLEPHAQRPHGGFDLDLEQQAHLLLPHHRHTAQAEAAGEEGHTSSTTHSSRTVY